VEEASPKARILADHFGIGRTAVNQHLATLRQRGYVVNGQVLKGRGRPRKSYVLTNDGINLFPKKYNWFSAMLLTVLQSQMGADRLADFMRDLGDGHSSARQCGCGRTSNHGARSLRWFGTPGKRKLVSDKNQGLAVLRRS
jgi:predicted ArsR family transcriptional regulator